MKNPLWLLILLPLLIGAESSTQLKFHSGNLRGASDLAKAEGKLYFVEFMADYCYICKMMDETTWRDQQVVDYVNVHYIPVKVNVDDLEGIPLKQKYDVKVLPTFIIFNAAGEEVGRYEESMSGSKMLATLTKYNTPQNRSATAVAGSPNTKSPSRPTAKPTPKPPVKVQPSPPVAAKSPTSKSSDPVPPSASDKEKAQARKFTEGSQGLYEFYVQRRASEGFGVQVGVYAQYGNVLREAANLESKFHKPILVNINTLDDQVVYRIIVGAFEFKAEAVSYGKEMESKGYTGIVRDLSQYQ
ncbi:MAG: thioredoxin domain-containing protein [Bacteroidota bacterium]